MNIYYVDKVEDIFTNIKKIVLNHKRLKRVVDERRETDEYTDAATDEVYNATKDKIVIKLDIYCNNIFIGGLGTSGFYHAEPNKQINFMDGCGAAHEKPVYKKIIYEDFNKVQNYILGFPTQSIEQMNKVFDKCITEIPNYEEVKDPIKRAKIMHHAYQIKLLTLQ